MKSKPAPKLQNTMLDHAKEFLAPVSYETELGEAWVEHHPLGIVMAVNRGISILSTDASLCAELCHW